MTQCYTKEQVRRTYIKRRNKLSDSVRAKRSHQACREILAAIDPAWGTIGLYEAFGSELDLDELAYFLFEKGYTVAFPRCLGNGYMDFYSANVPVPLPGRSFEENDAAFRSHRNDTVKLPTGFFEGTLHRGYDPFLPQLAHPARTVRLEDLEDCIRISPSELDLIVCPGVAFTTEGQRLGYGGGYYDRYLDRIREDCPYWGVCYKEQVRGTLPLETHDHQLKQMFIV